MTENILTKQPPVASENGCHGRFLYDLTKKHIKICITSYTYFFIGVLTSVYISVIMYISSIYIMVIAMDIIISNSSGEAIYEQIVSQVKAQIISGQLSEGDALPSMRALAQSLRISVITTKRAYEELERDGFIVSQTGKGSFVKGQNREFVREEYLRQTEVLITQACDKARIGGITAEELHELIDIIYNSDK